jgi:hypothetical protein
MGHPEHVGKRRMGASEVGVTRKDRQNHNGALDG